MGITTAPPLRCQPSSTTRVKSAIVFSVENRSGAGGTIGPGFVAGTTCLDL
jgi:hypothetical protein